MSQHLPSEENDAPARIFSQSPAPDIEAAPSNGGASNGGASNGGALNGGSPDAEQEPRDKSGISLVQVAIALVAIATFAVLRPEAAKTTAVFILTLSVLVFVHEWGHFQFARWAGMKVNRFAIGFPPFIYTKRVRGINYSVGALPIGGMVDIAGLGSEEEMVATGQDKVEGLLERTNTGEQSEKARREWAPSGGGNGKQFQEASLGWRFLTLFAGPLMNFVFAITLSIGLLSILGTPDLTGAKNNRVLVTMKGSPAAKAGVQPNDLVVGINGVNTDDSTVITDAIRASKNQPVTLQLKRQGQPLALKVTPEPKSIEVKKNVFETVPTVGIAFDIDPATIAGYKRVGIVIATKAAFIDAFDMSTQILSLVKRALTFKLTDTDKGSVGGPLAIAQAANSASEAGIYPMLRFAALLSINLGLLNLLPLPALDGGRILFLGYELVMRRPLDPRKEGLVHAAGMVLLLAFMLFITLRDVAPILAR